MDANVNDKRNCTQKLSHRVGRSRVSATCRFPDKCTPKTFSAETTLKYRHPILARMFILLPGVEGSVDFSNVITSIAPIFLGSYFRSIFLCIVSSLLQIPVRFFGACGFGRVFPAGVRPNSPSRGDDVFLPVTLPNQPVGRLPSGGSRVEPPWCSSGAPAPQSDEFHSNLASLVGWCTRRKATPWQKAWWLVVSRASVRHGPISGEYEPDMMTRSGDNSIVDELRECWRPLGTRKRSRITVTSCSGESSSLESQLIKLQTMGRIRGGSRGLDGQNAGWHAKPQLYLHHFVNLNVLV